MAINSLKRVPPSRSPPWAAGTTTENFTTVGISPQQSFTLLPWQPLTPTTLRCLFRGLEPLPSLAIGLVPMVSEGAGQATCPYSLAAAGVTQRAGRADWKVQVLDQRPELPRGLQSVPACPAPSQPLPGREQGRGVLSRRQPAWRGVRRARRRAGSAEGAR